MGWRGALDTVQRANLWLRTATRVVVRVGEFRARGFPELERQAKRLPWHRVVAADATARFRVTSKKSRLFHTGAIAERLGEVVAHATGATIDVPTLADDDDVVAHASQLFIVRLHRDVCTISVDASGVLLHRRGYRREVAKAPLRETLAAAMLLAAEWRGTTPLVDPMCGSGTIPIEGALLARRIAPGIRRTFAFERWPEHDAAEWLAIRAAAEGGVLPSSPVIIRGSDRDAGAITAARANAARAGVERDVEFSVNALSAVVPPPGPGLMIANPPYGERIGDPGPLRDLYAQLGNIVRRRCPDWTVALLSPDARLDGQLRLPMAERLRTSNGGIPVRLMVGTVEMPAGE